MLLLKNEALSTNSKEKKMKKNLLIKKTNETSNILNGKKKKFKYIFINLMTCSAKRENSFLFYFIYILTSTQTSFTLIQINLFFRLLILFLFCVHFMYQKQVFFLLPSELMGSDNKIKTEPKNTY